MFQLVVLLFYFFGCDHFLLVFVICQVLIIPLSPSHQCNHSKRSQFSIFAVHHSLIIKVLEQKMLIYKNTLKLAVEHINIIAFERFLRFKVSPINQLKLQFFIESVKLFLALSLSLKTSQNLFSLYSKISYFYFPNIS